MLSDMADDLDQRVARRVRELRAGRGLSLQALAAGSGVSRSMISVIERGEVHATAVVLERLATGLGVTLASLFVSAGCGALASHSLLTWEPQRGRIVAIATFALSVAIALLSPAVVDLCVGLSPAGRAVATALLAAPPGLLLGMPLPHGLRVVERVNPSLLPWALAVTACAMGLGGLCAVFVAMQFGYSALAFGSGLLFVPAFFAIDGLARIEMEPSGDAPAEGEGETAPAAE